MDLRRHLARLRDILVRPLRNGRRKAAHSDARSATHRTLGATSTTLSAGVSARRSGARLRGIVAWMEDGRRLRPRRRSPGHASSGGPSSAPLSAPRRPVGDAPAVPANPAARLGASGASLSASEAGQQVLSSSSPTPSASTLPPDIRVDFTGALSAETLAAIESMDSTQRRLIFLRYLVRQGVYNEGFSERVLPEQYWRSRGVQIPPPEQ